MKPCRDCQHEVSEQAWMCPHCGTPHPANPNWKGSYGFEYKSKAAIMGWPLVHISFKYHNQHAYTRYGVRGLTLPVPARGIIAIGQVACGVVTISQFGVGLVSVSQFTVAGFALAQFAVAYSLIAQMGLYIHAGHGQMVKSLLECLGL